MGGEERRGGRGFCAGGSEQLMACEGRQLITARRIKPNPSSFHEMIVQDKIKQTKWRSSNPSARPPHADPDSARQLQEIRLSRGVSNPTRRTPEERGAQGPGSLIPASYDTVLTWPDHSAASVGQLGRAGRPSRGGRRRWGRNRWEEAGSLEEGLEAEAICGVQT